VAYKQIGFLCLIVLMFSQEKFQLKDTHEIKSTSVKDQCKTGTCWSFSSASFIETELIRKGHEPLDLSEMYFVYHNYLKKADRYVKRHGNFVFSPGGLAQDNLKRLADIGMVPNSVYTDVVDEKGELDHSQLDALLEAYVKTLVKQEKISSHWKEGFEGILRAHLGTLPTEFKFEGDTYTPVSFAKKYGIKHSDYIELTSFTHQPFYSEMVLEIPDNWDFNRSVNVPLDEFVDATVRALEEGYSVMWDGDVSEETFDAESGLAVFPENTEHDSLFVEPIEEKEVTQESRQKMYESYISKDDHLMHLVGLAEDVNGLRYFIVKNSWGTEGHFNGRIYMSENYFKAKTISVLFHKEALISSIKKELN